MKKILIGISGASGAPIAFELLKKLKEIDDIETHLIMTESARRTIEMECNISASAFEKLVDFYYDTKDIGAGPASGSFDMDEMIIVPCSMKTVAAITCGYGENLLLRAADVTIKEGRPLILVARESPLSPIHLKNLHELSMMGVKIVPPMISFYQGYTTIEEWTDNFTNRLLNILGIRREMYHWGEPCR